MTSDPQAGAPGGDLHPARADGGDGVAAGYRPVDQVASVRANRRWWDAQAPDYLVEHGDFLGGDDFVWCPEGLREQEAGLLGDVRGLNVLEVGCGAAQCTRWLWRRGARAVGVDLSRGMLAAGRSLDAATGTVAPVLQADATRLPLAAASFDVACSAFGAVPFVEDGAALMAEVARVLRPGGRWVFSVTHPIRWAFPDDPGEGGLTACFSYFDRTAYAETSADGEVVYAEHHRTLGDRVAEVVGAGFLLERLVEPRWPPGHDGVWGGWSPLRGALLPGTAIFCCRLG